MDRSRRHTAGYDAQITAKVYYALDQLIKIDPNCNGASDLGTQSRNAIGNKDVKGSIKALKIP